MSDTDQPIAGRPAPNTQPPPGPPQRAFNLADSRLLHVALIILIIGILQVPMIWVESLIKERAGRQAQTEQEIGQAWGGQQTLIGPFLAIPGDGPLARSSDWRGSGKTLYLLPRTLAVNTLLKPEVRYRGIFQSVVHASTSTIQGTFVLPPELQSNPPENAHLLFAVGDARNMGLGEGLKWNDGTVALSPADEPDYVQGGTPRFGKLDYLKSEPISLAAGTGGAPLRFSLTAELRGHGEFRMVPMGDRTEVAIAGPWPSPSFIGNHLPDSHEITKDSFKAQWTATAFGRGFGSQWGDGKGKSPQFTDLWNAGFGVKPLVLVDSYTQVKRAAKYGNLILFATFLFYFLLDLVGKQRIHPIQFGILGLSLSLFHILLLSVSEITGFGPAYAISCAAIIGQAGLYGRSLAGTAMALAAALLLGALYGLLYLILGMESYALLGGAVVLFLGLSLLMYMTRHINWWQPAVATSPAT